MEEKPRALVVAAAPAAITQAPAFPTATVSPTGQSGHQTLTAVEQALLAQFQRRGDAWRAATPRRAAK